MVKKVHKYNSDGKSQGKEEITFIFNSQGYITTEIHGGAFSLSYEYDENGYLIRSVDVYGIEHEYEYEYDENGYLVQTDRERKKRSFANMKKNFYNKDGKLAKSQLFTQSEYSKKGIKLSSSAKYEKDKKKGLFELLSKETYVYDKNGKLLRIDDTKASALPSPTPASPRASPARSSCRTLPRRRSRPRPSTSPRASSSRRPTQSRAF